MWKAANRTYGVNREGMAAGLDSWGLHILRIEAAGFNIAEAKTLIADIADFGKSAEKLKSRSKKNGFMSKGLAWSIV